MGVNSAIEWTEATWNPVTGCTKISPGCKHCYAERMAKRLQAMGQAQLSERLPRHPAGCICWTCRCAGGSRRRIFVNSMSDLFHEDVPDAFIQRVFAVMRRAAWHRFQVLTKRAERLANLSPRLLAAATSGWGSASSSGGYTFRIDAPAADRGAGEIPVLGTTARTAAGPRPAGHRLGHRRR